MLNFLPKPQVSFLQWHITERCNFRCKHCYQTSYETPEMPTSKMLDLVDEYVELLELWGINGRMQITGGEPFVRKDMFEILEKIHDNRDKLKFNMMSNGSYITRNIAKKLKQLDVDFFQISIEGQEKTNDHIRGQGTFKKIVDAAKTLVEEGIRTSFSFTVTSLNSEEYFKVLEIAKSLGVQTLWSDRLVPWGAGKDIQEHMLQPFDVKQHYEKITSISDDLRRKKSKTMLSKDRTLYFLADPNRQDSSPWANHCDGVGTRGMTVLPDGTVYPCRRLPIKVGNVMHQSLFEIWYGSQWMWELRDKNNYKNPICGKCEMFERCGGGAPCIAYGYSGTPFATDPQCWKAFDKIPEAQKLADMAKIKTYDEPEFWDTINVQDNSRELGKYFEMKNGKMYYCNGSKIEVNSLREENPHHLYRLNLDDKFNQKQAVDRIKGMKIRTLFISLNNLRGDSLKARSELLMLLDFLDKAKVNYRLTRPLPRGWFGIEYFRISRRLNAPTSWKESMDLFHLENNEIKIRNVVHVDGPKVKYMPSRDQIYEYFSYFYNRPKMQSKPGLNLIQVGASLTA